MLLHCSGQKKLFPLFPPPPFPLPSGVLLERKGGGTNQRAKKGGKRKAKQLFASAPKAIHMPPLPCFSLFFILSTFRFAEKKVQTHKTLHTKAARRDSTKKGFCFKYRGKWESRYTLLYKGGGGGGARGSGGLKKYAPSHATRRRGGGKRRKGLVRLSTLSFSLSRVGNLIVV